MLGAQAAIGGVDRERRADLGQRHHPQAIEALIVFLIVISAYISIFFEWKMALAAIVAVVHDIVVTVGIYSIFSFLVTPDTVVAFLTVLGYSLYDTIVVFDRVRDNSRGLGATGKLTYTDVVNLSMNQTLARSINTSLVAILPILAVLVLGAQILGAVTLEYFGLALLIGLTSGAYSSIFIASPLLAMMKEHEPRYRQIRERLESRGTATQLLTPAAVAAGALSTTEHVRILQTPQRFEGCGCRQARRRFGQAQRGATAVKVADDEDIDDLDTVADDGSPDDGNEQAAGTTSTSATATGGSSGSSGSTSRAAHTSPPPASAAPQEGQAPVSRAQPAVADLIPSLAATQPRRLISGDRHPARTRAPRGVPPGAGAKGCRGGLRRALGRSTRSGAT